MIVIPAIDLLNRKVVRLAQGDYSKVTAYPEDPVELAVQLEQQGFSRLHLVDLEGARAGSVKQIEILKEISVATELIIDFGGGIKNEIDLELAFENGAQQVNIGSLAIQNPSLVGDWMKTYGPDRFILSADVRDGEVYISGWTSGTGKSIDSTIEEMIPHGLKTITCTDIKKDGMMSGPSTNLYKELIKKFPNLKIIASGGVSGIDDLLKLNAAGCYAAIAGKSILESKISADEIRRNNLSL